MNVAKDHSNQIAYPSKVCQDFADAVASGDPEKVLALYAVDGILKGTVSSSCVNTPDQRRAYFEKHFLPGKNDLRVEFITQDENSNIVAGDYVFVWSDDNGVTQAQAANYSYAVNEEGKIIQHFSAPIQDEEKAAKLTAPFLN